MSDITIAVLVCAIIIIGGVCLFAFACILEAIDEEENEEK